MKERRADEQAMQREKKPKMKVKTGRGQVKPDAQAIRRAEAAIKKIGEDFAIWAQTDLDEMDKAVADSLKKFTESRSEANPRDVDIIEAHVNAMRVVMIGDTRGGGGKLVEAVAAVQRARREAPVGAGAAAQLMTLAQMRAQTLLGVPLDPHEDPRAVAVVEVAAPAPQGLIHLLDHHRQGHGHASASARLREPRRDPPDRPLRRLDARKLGQVLTGCCPKTALRCVSSRS